MRLRVHKSDIVTLLDLTGNELVRGRSTAKIDNVSLEKGYEKRRQWIPWTRRTGVTIYVYLYHDLSLESCYMSFNLRHCKLFGQSGLQTARYLICSWVLMIYLTLHICPLLDPEHLACHFLYCMYAAKNWFRLRR